MTQHAGVSSSQCDYVLDRQLAQLRPANIVDFGAGAGKIGRMVERALGTSCQRIAVEGFEDAARMLRDNKVYDRVDTALIQEWLEKDPGRYSVAIFGDVIEHLTPRQIHAALKKCLEKFDYIIILVPLYDIFQDDAYGNPLEVHRAYITSGFFDRYKPVEKHIVEGDEFTIMNLLIPATRQHKPLYRRLSWRAFHYSMLALQPIGLARPTVDLLKRSMRRYKWLLR